MSYYYTTTLPDKDFISSFPTSLLYISEDLCKISLEPSFLQAEKLHLSLPLFVGEVLQSSDDLCHPTLDTLQQLYIILVLGALSLGAVMQVGPYEGRTEVYSHLPHPSGHLSSDAAQDVVCQAQNVHCWLASDFSSIRKHKVLLDRAALNEFSYQCVYLHGTVLTQVLYLALGLVEPH